MLHVLALSHGRTLETITLACVVVVVQQLMVEVFSPMISHKQKGDGMNYLEQLNSNYIDKTTH